MEEKEKREGWSRVDGGGGFGALKALEDIGWELEWEALWRWMQNMGAKKLLSRRCGAWTGFCWGGEEVLEFFGLSIEDVVN